MEYDKRGLIMDVSEAERCAENLARGVRVTGVCGGARCASSLRRSLRVQTAQAKLSARVVAIMPFILVAAFSLASPDFLSPFFSGPVGYGLLTLAIVMQLAGIVLVRRALSVDGVS